MYEQYFQDIIGHGAIKERLIRLMEKDRLPHAMIFAGPSGVGKTMMAFAVASALAGRRVFAGQEMKGDGPFAADGDEAYYVAPQGAMLKVDQFRQLQSRLILQGRAGRMRVCIIDHVETMNAEFANRMLKILEEPPQGVCFILVTDQPSLLLPTIVSRCAEIAFEPVGDAELTEGLLRLRGGRPADYEQAVAWGGGIVQSVLAHLDGGGGREAARALEFLRIAATHRCPYAKWLSVCADMTETETIETLRWAGMFLRDMAVLRSGAEPSLLRLKRHTGDMMKLMAYWTDDAIFAMLRAFDEGMEAAGRHVNTRLVWDYVCIQCIQAKGGI